jgi:hypothetical protein
MIEKFNEMDNSKKIPIIFSVSVILVIIVIVASYVINNNSGYNYDSIKKYSDKELVYTINSEKTGVFFKEIPYVNIDGSLGKSVNEDIDSYLYDYSDLDKIMVSYEYNINGRILSLVIKIVNYDVKNVPKVIFKTYNINLDDKVLLSDEDLLNIYNISNGDVDSIIENQFLKWYKDVQKKGYINEEECDYECFLKYREVDDYMDGIAYYIDGGKLVVYKPFVFYSIFGEENYFKEDDFEIILSE